MKNIKNLLRLCSIYCVLVAPSQAVPQPIKIGRQHDYPPYIFTQGDKTTGVSVELAEAVFERLEIEITYEKLPFTRMLAYGKSGDVDAVMLVFKTPEREAFLSYPTHHLANEENAFVTLKGTEVAYFGNLRDLQDYTIGVVRGFSYGRAFDQSNYIRRREVIDDETLLKMLVNDRFKVAVGSKFVLNYHADRLGVLEQLTFLEPDLFTSKPLYIGFSKANPDYEGLTARFSNGLKTIKESGYYERILKKYHLLN